MNHLSPWTELKHDLAVSLRIMANLPYRCPDCKRPTWDLRMHQKCCQATELRRISAYYSQHQPS